MSHVQINKTGRASAADIGHETHFKHMETAMKQDRVTEQAPRPLVFGEVLYDRFPDGSAVLGGAPFNVAWHLQGFGLAPLFISRIGDDEPGERILAAMSEWGMDTRGIQRDPSHPTGRVVVSIRDNEPSFEILPEQAYDFIDGESVEKLLREKAYGMVYHGSLIARHPTARAALDTLREADLPLFMDVNLRDPWWQAEWLDEAMRQARWAKLNEHELWILSQGEDDAELEIEARAEALRRACGLEVLVVTCGAAGALVLSEAALVQTVAGDVGEIVDTVGAGDAFSAVTMLGVIQAWPLEIVARRAVDFAAAVCRMRGATTLDRDLYRHYLRKWVE
jgi:fructokinase